MKEIIAIIRPKTVNATKNALVELGFPGVTAFSVLGRGKQSGIADEVNVEFRPSAIAQGMIRGMKYIPKRELVLVVKDDEVDTVVETIIKMNQSAHFGDGKIFVCPMDEAVRVRTGETGENAIM